MQRLHLLQEQLCRHARCRETCNGAEGRPGQPRLWAVLELCLKDNAALSLF